MRKLIPGLRLVVLAVLVWGGANAQDFEFRPPANPNDPATADAMRDLAERILPVYQDSDIQRYLANLSMLQLAAGNYAAADDSRQSLRDRQGAAKAAPGQSVPFDLYAHAKAEEATGAMPLAQAFTQAFKAVVPRLGDQDAYAVTAWLEAPPQVTAGALQVVFDSVRAQGRIEQQDAIDLLQTYVTLQARRSLGPLIVALAGEDRGYRYVSDDETLIRTPRGATIHIRSVHPKGSGRKRPALLEFALAPSSDDATAAAAHGYVGVVAYSRSRDGRIDPFVHDGADARKVIRWIARQPWSDGRVGMYGDGYAGFAAWAATKLPSPLKAIATADAIAPGIDFPAPGRVFRNSAYGWALGLEQRDKVDGDAAWMRAIDQKWYRSGKPYRSLDRVAGVRSRIFREWLTHPSYDRYWQKMIPFGGQFSGIGIPALSMTGYYADGASGALYYFTQHHQHRPDADHRLLLGPYDKGALPDGPAPLLRGAAVDAGALVDLRELRFQWFDHVFKGATLPPLLQERVNFEVMGANQWRHVDSLDAMAGASRRYYLDASGPGERHALTPARSAAEGFSEQSIRFADRGDAGWTAPAAIVGRTLPVRYGQAFLGEPLQQAMELDGLLSGQFDFQINRVDLDLNLTLYELSAGGDYLQLCNPYEFRASYAADPVHRRLLKAGERQRLDFSGGCLTSRRLAAGSRLALVLGVNKRPDREINYGSGKNVSEESIADGRRPLKIRWYNSSYIDLPVRK